MNPYCTQAAQHGYTYRVSVETSAELKHLHQGTRLSKKLTHIWDIKRYLQRIIIAKDSLLVVRHDEPFSRSRDLIIIPWHVIYGIVLALHLQLAHPSIHQLKMVFHRYFFALDTDQSIIKTTNKCHQWAAPTHQSTSAPVPRVGASVAVNVNKQNRQLILVLQESITSFTAATLIESERPQISEPALSLLQPGTCLWTVPLRSYRFKSLHQDGSLAQDRMGLEISMRKNLNKNPSCSNRTHMVVQLAMWISRGLSTHLMVVSGHGACPLAKCCYKATNLPLLSSLSRMIAYSKAACETSCQISQKYQE